MTKPIKVSIEIPPKRIKTMLDLLKISEPVSSPKEYRIKFEIDGLIWEMNSGRQICQWDLERGMQKLLEIRPDAFMAIFNDAWDLVSADYWLQCSMFGEIRFRR